MYSLIKLINTSRKMNPIIYFSIVCYIQDDVIFESYSQISDFFDVINIAGADFPFGMLFEKVHFPKLTCWCDR